MDQRQVYALEQHFRQVYAFSDAQHGALMPPSALIFWQRRGKFML
jgi:hypothetical protein